jgi:hypothetical protein
MPCQCSKPDLAIHGHFEPLRVEWDPKRGPGQVLCPALTGLELRRRDTATCSRLVELWLLAAGEQRWAYEP